MRLAYAGREWLHIEIESAPSGTIQVTFDAGATWWPTVRMSSTEVAVMVAGPGAVANPLNTVVLPVGFYGIFARLYDGVEDVYRPVGTLLIDDDIGAGN
jgi:hypothetical protein